MLLGGGYLGDFLGDPFAFTKNETAGINNSSQVNFYFNEDAPLPTGGKIFAYGNGVILDRDLVSGETFLYSGTENAFASPGIAPGLDDGVYDPLAGLKIAQYEVARSFNAYANITVRRINWAVNSPRILEAEHACKIDSADILSEGTMIAYDDADLGRVFYGKIVDAEKNYKSGEGVTYRCADLYRTLTKTPARRDFKDQTPVPVQDYAPGISQLRFDKTDGVNDTIRKLLELVKTTVIPGGIASALPDYATMKKALDKVGQSIAQWLDDVLDQTEGGVCYIDPITHALRVRDFYQEADVTLTQGSYTVVTPSAVNPLIVEGGIKSSLNNKYEKVVVESVGKFTRRIDVPITPVYQNGSGVENPTGVWLYVIRFYFPDSNILGFFYDENDEVQSEIHIDFQYQIDANPPVSIGLVLSDDDIKRVTDSMDPNFNKLYRDFAIVFNHTGQPAFVVANVKARYTRYEGPYFAEIAASDQRLKGEGTYLVQRPDLFYFESAGFVSGPDILELPKTGSSLIDPMTELYTQASALQKRHSTRPDVAGRVAVHMKGLTASIVPGTRITNFDARVQSIEFDIANRNLMLDLSDVPIRREVQDQKDAAVMRGETVRQLNVNSRFGVGDVSPIRMASFNRRANMIREDCCADCDCPEGS